MKKRNIHYDPGRTADKLKYIKRLKFLRNVYKK